jgi:DNA-binding NarL/FixJ family response regulator
MTKTIRVAVCDDARAVKFFLRTVLEEEGDMQVVSTSSGGQEALRALAEHEADILLLDFLLPDVPDPADLVREIRERWPSTAILLMSNLPASQLQKEAERLGTDGWTPKAHKPEQLRQSVRDIIAARA